MSSHLIVLYANKYECTGCSACEMICSQAAISMKIDEEGFVYPVINQSKCIHCMKCLHVCPLKKSINQVEYEYPIDVYAIKHKSNNIRINSSSGGIFTAITDEILRRKGVIYGASYNNEMKVVHKSAYNEEKRNEMRSSKYVQSDIAKVYYQVFDDLRNDKEVAFFGTPCQTAGLISLLNSLNQDCSKLIVIDIVCHGVPSPLIWNDYLSYIEKTRNRKVTNYIFRDKQQGWRGYKVRVEYNDGKNENGNEQSDLLLYTKLYITNKVTRPSCYKCIYANTKRPSDIMIGDYWGIEKKYKYFDDNLGVSLVYLNSKKGIEYFNKISSDLTILKSNIEDSLQMNLTQPTPEPVDRKEFWRDYKNMGFLYAAKRHTRKSIYRRIKNKIRRILQ